MKSMWKVAILRAALKDIVVQSVFLRPFQFENRGRGPSLSVSASCVHFNELPVTPRFSILWPMPFPYNHEHVLFG